MRMTGVLLADRFVPDRVDRGTVGTGVEILVLAQDGHQVPLVPDRCPVKQLTAAAADPALHDRIHPRRLNARADNLDASGPEDLSSQGTQTSGTPRPAPDLIVANPTYIAPGQLGQGHVEAIIRSAAVADYEGRWAFDVGKPAAVIKTGPTEKSAGQAAVVKRAAASALRRVLHIPDPSKTQGRYILVFDDVCTTGRQLNAVAECLLDEGGTGRVRGLVLGRAPWKPR